MNSILYLSVTLTIVLLPLSAYAQDTVFTIGAAFGLTGDASTFGREELNGVQLALEEVNARGRIKVALKVEDTISTGLGTVSAIKKLVEVDSIKVIIGPTWLDSFQGGLPIAEKREVLLITPSASMQIVQGSAVKYQRVFSTYFNFQREIEALMQEAARRGVKRIAVLVDQDPYFVEMRRIALEVAPRVGVEVVFDQEFSSGEENFRSLIQRAMLKHVDAIAFASASQASALSFLKQRKQLAPKVPVLGSHDFEGHERNPAFSGMLEGVLYVAPAKARESFLRSYKSRFSGEPIMTASNAYDALMILATALEVGATTPDKIASYFREHEFDTVSFGVTRFSPLGGIDGGAFFPAGSLSAEFGR